MRHWGRGRYQHLSIELRHPQARTFSDDLFRVCGCRLAFQKMRGVHVVYRDRGSRPPKTYLDVGGKCPLQVSWVPFVARAVRWADARENKNWGAMWDEINSRMKTDEDKDLHNFVDDRLPDFFRDLSRLRTMLSGGRVDTPFIDLGASRL